MIRSSHALILFLFTSPILICSISSGSSEIVQLSESKTISDNDSPIIIEGDGSFNSTNGVESGSGTHIDPYVIENNQIDLNHSHGISIFNTTKYFIIRKCTITNGSNNNGIYLMNTSNGRIEECILNNNSDGIRIENSANILLENNSINGSKSSGLFVYNSTNIQIKCNSFFNNTNSGLIIRETENVDVLSNQCNSNYEGIACWNSNNLSLIQNECNENLDDGIYLRFISNSTISSNLCNNNSYHGIFFHYSARNCTVSQNLCNSNRYNGINVYSPYDSYCNTLIIENNSCYYNSYGLAAGSEKSKNIIIQHNICNLNSAAGIGIEERLVAANNICNNNGHSGIIVITSKNVNLTSNECKNNPQYGLFVFESRTLRIENNSFMNNYRGIRVEHSYYINISKNSISNNTKDGIQLIENALVVQVVNNSIIGNSDNGLLVNEQCFWNTYRGNVFQNNKNGIFLNGQGTIADISNNSFIFNTLYGINSNEGSFLTIGNNSFYGGDYSLRLIDSHANKIYNNLFNNSNYIISRSTYNTWNLEKTQGRNIVGGEFIGGNYWTNYYGEDIDGDGLGDTYLPHGPGDNSPLVIDHPTLDIVPPSVSDISKESPKTGRFFIGSYLMSDNRKILNFQADVDCSYFCALNQTWKSLKVRNSEIIDEIYFNLSVEIPDYAKYLIVDIQIIDIGGNVGISKFNYTVEDIILPWFQEIDFQSETETGSRFDIIVTTTENIEIIDRHIEFYFNDDTQNVTREIPIQASEDGFNFSFSAYIIERSREFSFRLVIKDFGNNEMKSMWYHIPVMDTINPFISEVVGPEPENQREFTLEFIVEDNIGLSQIKLDYYFDDIKIEEVIDHTILDSTWQYSFFINPEVEELRYWIQVKDKSDNSMQISGSYLVRDTSPPEIIDITEKFPITGKNHTIRLIISDNKWLNSGFIEWWFDDDIKINVSQISEKINIGRVPDESLILYYRVGMKDNHSNWNIMSFSRNVIDGTAPNFHIQYDIPFTSHQFNVNVIGSDNRNITGMELLFSLNQDSARYKAKREYDSFSINISEDVTSINLYFSVWDEEGNTAKLFKQIEVEDGTPPIINNIEIIQISDRKTSIIVEANDNVGIETCWAVIYWDSNGQENYTLNEINGVFEITIDTPRENISIDVGVEDINGNVRLNDTVNHLTTFHKDSNLSLLLVILTLIIISLIAGIGVFFFIRRRPKGISRNELRLLKEIFWNFKVGTSKNEMDCYKILGVPENASEDTIRRRYRALAQIYHPDKNRDHENLQDNLEMMNRINCAKEILLDNEKRKILDEFLNSKKQLY